MVDCIVSSPFFILLLLMKVFPICWVVKPQEAAVFWSAFAYSFRWYSLSLNLFLSRFKSPMNIRGLSDCDAFSTCWSIFFSLSLWEEMVSFPSWLCHSLYTPAIMILLPCSVSTSIHIIGTPASIRSVLTRTFSFICGLIRRITGTFSSSFVICHIGMYDANVSVLKCLMSLSSRNKKSMLFDSMIWSISGSLLKSPRLIFHDEIFSSGLSPMGSSAFILITLGSPRSCFTLHLKPLPPSASFFAITSSWHFDSTFIWFFVKSDLISPLWIVLNFLGHFQIEWCFGNLLPS